MTARRTVRPAPGPEPVAGPAGWALVEVPPSGASERDGTLRRGLVLLPGEVATAEALRARLVASRRRRLAAEVHRRCRLMRTG